MTGRACTRPAGTAGRVNEPIAGAPGPATAEDLLALTSSLVAVPSPSHAEGPLADLVEAALRACPWLATDRVGDNVVARTHLGRARRVVVAGHLDTVPATADNAEPRRQR